MLNQRICVGVFGSAHGVRGQVRIKSETANPLDIAKYSPLSNEGGNVFYEITDVRPVPKNPHMVVARVKGIDDRNKAEALTNIKLYCDRNSLPELEDEDEFYHADLMGMAVYSPANVLEGHICAIFNFGSGEVLEILNLKKQRIMIPFTKEVVPSISLKERSIVLAQPLPIEP